MVFEIEIGKTGIVLPPLYLISSKTKSKLNKNETKIKPSFFMMESSQKKGRCFYARI
jgi:hypothetical protein